MGVLQLSLQQIFETIKTFPKNKIAKIYISYFEIYNEVLIDLLNPKGDPSELRITDDEQVGALYQQYGITIVGLRQQKVRKISEALHLLKFGEEYRKYRVTDYNTHSSRSHAIFKVFVETRELIGGTPNSSRLLDDSDLDNSNLWPSSLSTFSCLVRLLMTLRTWWIWLDRSG